MRNKSPKRFYFGILILSLIITSLASNGYKNGIETDSDMALINFQKESTLDLLNKLNTGLNDHSIFLRSPLVKKTDCKKTHKSQRKTKTKSNFRIFNINTLFNPAGLFKKT